MQRGRGTMCLFSWCLGAVFMFVVITRASACPIPVFQYSLEYWSSDPYDVVVHYNGEFTDEQQVLVDRLREAAGGGSSGANIKLTWRDYSAATIAPAADRDLPGLEVRYPGVSGLRGTLWEGPLEHDAIEEMLHSPMRQEIAEKLLDRHAGVWILLESGNPDEDTEARRILEEELARLEETLKVPDPSEEYGIDFGEIYTDIRFSLLTLGRDDPEEQMFIRMLLGTEQDLEDYADRPMVFPIYGRGLILYALVGDGINPWTLAEAGAFLTGPCSCQVKASNPGTDILMSFDWKSQVERRSTYNVPDAPATGGFLDRMDEAEDRLRNE